MEAVFMVVIKSCYGLEISSLNHGRQLTAYIEDDDNECEVNPAPLICLILTIVFWMGIFILVISIDQYEEPLYKIPEKPVQFSHQPLNMRGTYQSQGSNSSQSSIEQGESSISSESDQESENYDIQQVVFQVKPNLEPTKKTVKLGIVLQYHLTFGIKLYRGDFPRMFRVFIVLSIWLFQLFLIGAFFAVLEDVDSGEALSSENIISEYSATYFAYSLVSVLISFPFWLCFSWFLNRLGQISSWIFYSVQAGINFISLVSIIGVVFLSYDFCHEWGGYWAISYIIAILIQVLIVETCYMVYRYFSVIRYN